MDDNSPEETTVTAYSQIHHVDKETARERLNKKYKEEVESVDAKEIALKCMKAIRVTLPKVQGFEGRESDVLFRLKNIERSIEKLENENMILKKIAKQSVETVNAILQESEQQKEIIKPKITIYEKICLKITSMMRKLKK